MTLPTNAQETKCDPPVTHHRANDIWISVTMMATLLSIVAGVISVNRLLTDSAVQQEGRFIRLEESVKALREDVIEQKQIRLQRGSNGYYDSNTNK